MYQQIRAQLTTETGEGFGVVSWNQRMSGGEADFPSGPFADLVEEGRFDRGRRSRRGEGRTI